MKKTNWIFLVAIPLFILSIFIIAFSFPSLSNQIGGLSVIASFVATILTYFYVVLTWMMVRQIAEAQENERRPYVIVDIEIEKRCVWFVVENIGRAPAKNITISTVPEIIDTVGKKMSDTIFSVPMKFMPPGKKFRALVKTVPDMLTDGSALEYKVYTKYWGTDKQQGFTEEYTLNIDFHLNRLTNEERDIRDVYFSLEKMVKTLESIAQSLHR